MVQADFIERIKEEVASISNFENDSSRPATPSSSSSSSSIIEKPQTDGKMETTSLVLRNFSASKRMHSSSVDIAPKCHTSTEEIPAKRSRGRPQKTEPIEIQIDEIEGMHPLQRDRKLYRLKNNAASRRSRLNRKIKDEELFHELDQLQKKNSELVQKDSELDEKIKRMKEKYIQLLLLL